ncbi:hypothetical protein EX87_18820 (plasmid) [Brevibacillus laterosporus]|uniref:Uncharacterized protein n=1 Tax=Brevibacillus laterosporus TaxID=1465 RepID=A0A0F7C1I9_BRELA|nr:hypothetical protein [Brevibacillus laterosporus]AKF95694.1 hypothetical protein EX87_18820 [Brevibacillus laterosporus]
MVAILTLAGPALAQDNVVSSVQPNKYCKECNTVNLKYPKKDDSRSYFKDSYLTYGSEQYQSSHIDDNLSTGTHWETVWVKE